jgi:hypothetical protein
LDGRAVKQLQQLLGATTLPAFATKPQPFAVSCWLNFIADCVKYTTVSLNCQERNSLSKSPTCCCQEGVLLLPKAWLLRGATVLDEELHG